MKTYIILGLMILTGCTSPPDPTRPTPTEPALTDSIPTWQDLTDFESETLRSVRDAPSAESLFRLALLMGGEIRTRQQAEPMLRAFREFLLRMESRIAEEPDLWQKGFVLFQKFYESFLEGPDSDQELTHYERDQSRVDVVLERKSYNCISSAVLYALFADAAGFEAEGILLPSHALVRLGHPDWDKTVEVETTSRLGYDWVHDEAYYDRGADAWSRLRGLGSRPPTRTT